MTSGFFTAGLAEADPDLFAAVRGELRRQQEQIELIASENIVSRAVLEAQGSVLTNKYAEGYPGRRYYGGCEYVDVAETLAIERAKALFSCGFANVQPHSGAQANGAVKLALCQPGDVILGMSLDAGGHLTHGAKPNISGKWFKAVQYGVRRDNALIDFEQIERLALEHRPRLIIAGASAYSRIIDFERFRQIADSVGAYLLVDMAHVAGLVAVPGVSCATPEATFYVFPNVTDAVDRLGFGTVSEFASAALRQTGVSFCTRHHFGTAQPDECERYIRLAYSGISVDAIEEGLGKLATWVGSA